MRSGALLRLTGCGAGFSVWHIQLISAFVQRSKNNRTLFHYVKGLKKIESLSLAEFVKVFHPTGYW